VIDVGVAHGTFEIYRAFPNAKFLLVEPMREFQPALDWIARRYDCRVELAAAGRSETEGTVYFDSGPTKRLHGASLASHEGQAGIRIRDVPVKRLDDMARAHGFKGPMLLKVDTQGTELEVLAGAEALWPDIEVVILEAVFFRFVPEAPTLLETLSFMETKGFVPYDIFGGRNRPLDGALANVDVAFVRKDGMFRSDHRYLIE